MSKHSKMDGALESISSIFAAGMPYASNYSEKVLAIPREILKNLRIQKLMERAKFCFFWMHNLANSV